MRTSDERIEAMYRRAQELETENRIHRTRIMQTVCAACGFILVVAIASFMPVFSDKIAPHSTEFNMNGSILSGNGMLGYIVIGIIAFALGIAVTVFCYQIKKYQTGNDEDAGSIDKRRDIL